MTEQPRPDFTWVKDQLEERRSLLAAMHTEQGECEDWFDAGTSEAAVAKIRTKLRGLPKKGWATRYIPIPYLGVMVGANQVHNGASIDSLWRLPVIDGYEYRDPKDPSKSSEQVRKERERKVGRWIKAATYVMDTFTPDGLVRELVIKLIALGEGCVTYSVNYDQWPDPPFGWVKNSHPRRAKEPRADRKKDQAAFRQWQNKRARAFPFTVQNVHPTVVFFDPHNPIPYDYIREEKIKRGEAERLVPELATRQQSGAGEDCTRVTYVSCEWIGQWIDGEPLYKDGDGWLNGVKVNTSGLPLHRMAFGGFGSTNRTGDFVTKGQGIISQGRHLIAEKIVLMNQMSRIIGLSAFQPLGLKDGTPEERAKLQQEMTYEPGETVDLGDVTVVPFPEIKIPNSILQQIEMVDRQLEKVFGPDLMEGQRAPGETLGGQRNRYSLASAVYRAAEQAARQLMAAVIVDLLHLIKYELREEVPAMGGDGTIPSIGPDDIDDGGMALLDFSPPTEEDKAFKEESVLKKLNIIITPEEAAEELGYENPAEHVRAMRVQAGIDMILKSDTYMKSVIMLAMQEMGMQQPAAPVGAPAAEATPSGQAMGINGSMAGNPEQQAAYDSIPAPTRG